MTLYIRREQFAALRRDKVAAGLVKHYEEMKQPAWRDPDTGDVLVEDVLSHKTRYGFDKDGFVGSVTTPSGRKYILKSTLDGDLARIANPNGRQLELSYDEQGCLHRLREDSRDMCQFELDSNQRLEQIRYYDKTSTRLAYSDSGNLSVITNRLGYSDVFEFDLAGELTSLLDGNGNRSRFIYSKWNRPSRVIFPDGSGEYYSFNPAGRIDAIRVDAETVVRIKYDDGGHPTTFHYGDGRTLSFEYDEGGRPKKATDNELTVAFEYDDKGRVVADSQGGHEVKYAYDLAGSLVKLNYPSGDSVQFTYDPDRRLTSVIDWNGGVYHCSYKPSDAGYSWTFPDGLCVDITQSTASMPINNVTTKPGESLPLFSRSCKYDIENRLVETVDSAFGTRAYSYDAEGQLLGVTASGPAPAETFAYDPIGNRIAYNGVAASFDSLNRLSNQGAEIAQYDSRGNMIRLGSDTGSWVFTFNHQNQLTAADGPSGIRITFGYDPFNRRIHKHVECDGALVSHTDFVWAGEHLIAETEVFQGKKRVQEYLYYPGSHIPLATRIDGAVYLYHCDHLGVPIRLTDVNGRIVWGGVSGPFGQFYAVLSEVPNSLRAPGQYHDRETGLHYNRFRYYAPALGRYISRDPVSFLQGPNFYTYVGNDPVNRADPLGLWWKAAVSVLAGVAAAAVVVATAPVSVPALIIAAGAAAMGVGVGIGVNKALNLKEFCLSSFLSAFAQGFFQGAAITALAIAAALAFPAAATAIAVGGAVVGIGLMLNEHLGLVDLGPLGGKKSYDEMTPEEQNQSLGGLWGGLTGSAVVGEGAAKVGGGSNDGYPGRTAESDAAAATMVETMKAEGVGVNRGKAVTAISHEDGSVSIGTSGSSKDAGYVSNKVDGQLPENYTVGGDMSNPEELQPAVYPNGDAHSSKTCAETRAWQAASQNPSPPTGQTTIWRGSPETNPYPSEPNSSAMEPCPSCAKNAPTIMGQPPNNPSPVGNGVGVQAPVNNSKDESKE